VTLCTLGGEGECIDDSALNYDWLGNKLQIQWVTLTFDLS